MNPTIKQNALIAETQQLVSNRSTPTFIAAEAAPGSGKTFTIIESLILSSKELKYGERILVLAFNSKMKDDLQKKIDKSDVNSELFDIRTVHSLFFRQAKSFEQGEGSFSLDFTKGIFTEDMVRAALSSMCVGGEPIHNEVQDLLASGRVFSQSLVTPANVRVLTYYVNAYFSTAAKLSQTDKLTEAARFFAKSDIAIDGLDLTKNDSYTLSLGREALPEKTQNRSDAELLLTLLLHRIGILAKMTTPKEIETISIPVDLIDTSGAVTHKSFERSRPKKDAVYAHVYKVPHNYYYKSFYAKAIKDPSFLANTFASYGAVFIDEAQDNDKMFFDVLKRALELNIIKVCVAVGDSDQSIYAFKSPDHFNMLKAAERLPEKSGIVVKRFALDETFRFGSGIASFVTDVFSGTSIIGAAPIKGAVYPESLDIESLAKFLRGSEGTKTAIVCRTNAEATAIALELKKLPEGSGALRLHKSLREDLKKIYGGGSTGEGEVELEELTSSKRFNPAEIRKHLLSSERISSTNIILSAHQSKGDEFDYVVIAGDFFRNDNHMDEPKLSSALSFMDEVPAAHNDEFFTRLNDPALLEERNTLYVALTRAKKGMLFMHGALADTLLPIAKKHADDPTVLSEISAFLEEKHEAVSVKHRTFKEQFPTLFPSH
ncbi:MAG: UvrD-helicase domain-containing protein [Paludibacter sp.]|nr:UvrD-helicase domain-containing protein [Paludibacter sp.]